MDRSTYSTDYVRIFDGDSYGQLHLMAQLTLAGGYLPSNISTVRSKMLIVFDTDPSGNSRGFKANIFFEEANTDNKTNACTVLSPCHINEGHCHYDGQCYGTLRCGYNNCPQNSDHGPNCCYDYCGQFLDMNTGILDYYFPDPFIQGYYPDMQSCSWLIQVEKNQLISLGFLGFYNVSFQNLLLEKRFFFYTIFCSFFMILGSSLIQAWLDLGCIHLLNIVTILVSIVVILPIRINFKSQFQCN